jgi:hypothetical protein
MLLPSGNASGSPQLGSIHSALRVSIHGPPLLLPSRVRIRASRGRVRLTYSRRLASCDFLRHCRLPLRRWRRYVSSTAMPVLLLPKNAGQ